MKTVGTTGIDDIMDAEYKAFCIKYNLPESETSLNFFKAGFMTCIYKIDRRQLSTAAMVMTYKQNEALMSGLVGCRDSRPGGSVAEIVRDTIEKVEQIALEFR